MIKIINFSLILILLEILTNASCEDSPSVIIIGAGPSGIAAATKLYENGITNFTILEAENRIGGRIYSAKLVDEIIDLGAEFCHGKKDNVVYKLANVYNVLQHLDVKLDFYYSSQENVDENFFGQLFHIFSDIHHDGEKYVKDNISVGEYLTKTFV
ncbi:hypothetical protein ILUMI_11502 [Ignelater luminosus]|uniref:Amine oxidase domain-containing protein n=1 Tax=Ignelater luminosus TaxID=2038154 RepID=A0A8K0CVV5_IGNLU|nr:hypothetical protein ILUMI_11502 [Ignelater luminosus]